MGAETLEKRPQTVGVVEDNDAALLGLGLLGVHHGRAHDEIHRRVLSQATRHHAEGVFTREELVGVKDWRGRERGEQDERRRATRREANTHMGATSGNSFHMAPVGVNSSAP